MSQRVESVLKRKAGNGRGFLLEGNESWFNASKAVEPYLAKIEVGTAVVVEYFKKGIKQEATKIYASASKPLTTEVIPKVETTSTQAAQPHVEKPYVPRIGGYGSPEDVAGKEVGCAAGCAASALAGRQEDPETLLEMWRILFAGILDHIRANK